MAPTTATASMGQGAQGGAQRPGMRNKQSLGTYTKQVVGSLSATRDAAIALLQRPASRKQQDGASQRQDQSEHKTIELRGQLTASEEKRQQLQQEYDALSTSHDALTARCSQLERQLQASQSAEASSSAKAAAANQKLENMRQQLKDANRFLDQQQKINKQQAAQLQKALSSLEGGKWKVGNTMAAAAATQQQLQQALGAKDREVKALSEQVAQLSAACRDNKKILAAADAEGAAVKQHLSALQQRYAQLQAKYNWVETESAAAVEGYKTEQRKTKRQLADMAAALAAAETAMRRTQRDEAALLQAMAHLTETSDFDRLQMEAYRDWLKTAEAQAKHFEGLSEWYKMGVTETHERMLGLVVAAERKLVGAETEALTYKVAVKRMRVVWDECIDEIEADIDQLKAQHKQQVAEVQQQAAAERAELEGQVAQLRSRLGLDVGCGTATSTQPEVTIKQQGAKGRGLGLKLLWQNIRSS